MEIASANFQWDISDNLELTYIASSTYDLNRGQSPQNFPATLLVTPAPRGSSRPARRPWPFPTGSGFNPNIVTVPNGLGLGALIETNTRNKRRAVFAGGATGVLAGQRVSYVVGAYFADTNADVADDRNNHEPGVPAIVGHEHPTAIRSAFQRVLLQYPRGG